MGGKRGDRKVGGLPKKGFLTSPFVSLAETTRNVLGEERLQGILK